MDNDADGTQTSFSDPSLQDLSAAADISSDESEETEALEFPTITMDDDVTTPGSVRRGADVIRSYWRHAPPSPGVYRMIADNGDVLYVGKAKNLRKRIAAYVRPRGHTLRILRMIAQTASMLLIATETETEALLLEVNLIKQLKPRFNILMRDDKSFPYILLAEDDARADLLVKHRGARNRKGRYFGPFAHAGAVNRTLNALQRAFLLRTCENSYYDNRTRPCLQYQIKRCSGPCTGEISSEQYRDLARQARDFLSGRSRAVKEALAHDMQEAADTLDFEQAARLRDRIAALSLIQGQQGVNQQAVEEADVFALHEEAGQFCVEVFFFRAYQNWGNRPYFPRADHTLAPGVVLSAFIAQFYADRPSPRLILTSHHLDESDLIASALSQRNGAKIEIAHPQRGEKRDMVDYALNNARETLSRRLAEAASQHKLLNNMAAAFGFSGPLRRVEIYDNSHISGNQAVGAMVVAGENGFMKAHYRTFNIKQTDAAGDDYAMMREVLTRRFARLLKDGAPQAEDSDEFPTWPDLIIIDGGKGQFETARRVLQELSLDKIMVVGVAKGVDRDAGRETFHLEGKEPFRLPPRDPTLYFVQRLRDEAHRFAIGTHRARRKKEFVKNPLDEIPGVGPTRKKALLKAFGTAKGVAGAAVADLAKVHGVNIALAQIIYDYFHDRD